MAAERAILCGGVAAGRLPVSDPCPLRLARHGTDANVTLGADAVRRELAQDVPPALRDLLDIAAYVYTADQAISRGSLAATDQGASWRRRQYFRVPVRVPDLWRDAETTRLLVELLSFLSDDTYEFDFRPWAGGEPGQTPLLDFKTTALTGEVDEVVMFSGGLDSLGGAVEEVVNQGRRVLLLNHRSNPKPVPAQKRLVDSLTERAVGNRPQFMAVWGKKRKALNKEYTQRSRSFLFASLGVTVAHMIGLQRFRFYENGVVSLNLPLAGQVVGGRATRTTHPKVLAGFRGLFSRVIGRGFGVENPFLWKTKTEVVRLIGEAGLAGSIGYAGSCTHTWARPASKTHCGDCSQCIDRRFAVLAAGLAGHDPADGYNIDLLVGDRSKEVSRLLVAGYLETVRRIRSMNDPRQFLDRFAGEVGRVLPHIPGGADANARLVYDLLRRHAEQVWGAVEQGLVQHISLVTQRQLPPRCLLRQVIDSDALTPPTAPAVVAVVDNPPPAAGPNVLSPGVRAPDSHHVFRSTGQCWLIGLAGSELKTLLPSRGAAYLHELLASPGVTISSTELACRIQRRNGRIKLPTGGDLSDAQAVDAYSARYEELSAELAEARANGDVGARERYGREMAELAAEIKRVVGLGGRIRPAANAAERARKAVVMAISRTLADIAKYAPDMSRYLKRHMTGGMDRTYTSPDGIPWQL